MCTDETPGRLRVARRARHIDGRCGSQALIRIISSLAIISAVTNVLGGIWPNSSECQKTFAGKLVSVERLPSSMHITAGGLSLPMTI
jgi:hypothetical protein